MNICNMHTLNKLQNTGERYSQFTNKNESEREKERERAKESDIERERER